MKWFSIKEFNPPASTECLVRTMNTTHYVARLEDVETPDTWLCDYYCEECGSSGYEKIHGITHFALIEPTPV